MPKDKYIDHYVDLENKLKNKANKASIMKVSGKSTLKIAQIIKQKKWQKKK